MNSINKYIKHLSLFLIVTGLVLSSGTFKMSTPSIPESDSLWDSLRADFTLDHATSEKLVQTHRDWYLDNPEYIDDVFSRAEPYLYYIAEEIKKRDLPMEFILIPVVESTYDPTARSHRGATGLWQLMAATARHYGVVQNVSYDGRKDISASTKAALDHLVYLSEKYDNDWYLVLAAYNMGEGALGRAIRKNERAGLPTDFWSLKLSRETTNYVPKIIALADVIKNYHGRDIMLPAVANEPQVAEVYIDAEDHLDLTIAANLAEVEPEELREINPGFNQPIIANNTRSILLPADKVKTFKAALKSYTPEKKSTLDYIVQNGDSLSKVAKTYNVSVAMLQQYNNLSTTTIVVGQKLRIPRMT